MKDAIFLVILGLSVSILSLRTESSLFKTKTLEKEYERYIEEYSSLLTLAKKRLITFRVGRNDSLHSLREKLSRTVILSKITGRSILIPKLETQHSLLELFSIDFLSKEVNIVEKDLAKEINFGIKAIHLCNTTSSILRETKEHLLLVDKVNCPIFWENVLKDPLFVATSMRPEIGTLLENNRRNWFNPSVMPSRKIFSKCEEWESTRSAKNTCIFAISTGEKLDLLSDPPNLEYVADESAYSLQEGTKKEGEDLFSFGELLNEAESELICSRASFFFFEKRLSSHPLTRHVLFLRNLSSSLF